MGAHLAVELRSATAEDEPLLRGAFASTRAAEIAALGPAADAFVAGQYDLQQRGFRAAFPNGETLVIDVGGEPAGRVLLGRSPGTLHLFDIAVLAAHRGRGVGTAALRAVCAAADTERRDVTLAVERDDRAIDLYERLGFVVVGQDERHLAMARPLS